MTLKQIERSNLSQVSEKGFSFIYKINKDNEVYEKKGVHFHKTQNLLISKYILSHLHEIQIKIYAFQNNPGVISHLVNNNGLIMFILGRSQLSDLTFNL